MNIEDSTADSASSSYWKRDAESFINDDKAFRIPLIQTTRDSLVSILNLDSHKLSKKFNRTAESSTSTSDSESSSDWEKEAIHNSLPETDSHYSSLESLELSNLDDSSTTSDESEDNSEGPWHKKCSSSTSDMYDSSDNDVSGREEFFDSSTCSIHNDTDLDQSIRRQSINCSPLSSNTNSNASSKKFARERGDLARSKKYKSQDEDNSFESRRKSNHFSRDDFASIAETDCTTGATTRNGDVDLETATDGDSVDDLANVFAEKQCWMRLDLLLRLKKILLQIISDYKENGSEVCAKTEQRIREIIEESEHLMQKQEPPERLETIQEEITRSTVDESETQTSTSEEVLRIPAWAQSNWNYDNEQASDGDSSDSDDDRPLDCSEDFKKYFDKYSGSTTLVNVSAKKSRSWKDHIDRQQRKNWAESIAYVAETQIEPKLGKKIDQEGLKRFGESIEWEIFHFRAESAVEYSNLLCDKHSEIGHGRMTESEREYLMFLAYRNH